MTANVPRLRPANRFAYTASGKIESCAIAIFVSVLMSGAAQAGENSRVVSTPKPTPKHFAAGIDVDAQPRVEDTGLPLYPGATIDRTERTKRDERGRHVDGDEDGVNLNLWFGSFGLKVVVIKLKTTDSAEKVGAFYRDALEKYGEILDCSVDYSSEANSIASETRSKTTSRREGTKSNALTCKDIQMKKASVRDGKLYKAGVRQKQYGVAIQSKGDGTTFQLFHFEKRGGDD
jgi:hypothetical protein